MAGTGEQVQDFSKWDGTTPFFQGTTDQGRHAYVMKSETTFDAYLALDAVREVIGMVTGSLSQMDRFMAQMKLEGAHVSYGTPPFDTNTGGEKPISDTTKPGRRPVG
jgi:hypothetical protein